MSNPLQKFYSNQFANAVPGEIHRAGSATADITSNQSFSFVAAYDFRFDNIGDLFLVAPNTGTDASNPLSVALEVTIGGTSVFSTKPSIDKTASDGATTLAAGTGITVGVIDTANNAGSAGDVVTVTVEITRTASPTDEMVAQGVVKVTPLADYDSDMTVQRLAS